MKKKKRVMVCLFGITPLLAVAGVWAYLNYLERPVPQDLHYVDSGIQLENPERGWYTINGVAVDRDGAAEEEKIRQDDELVRQCEELNQEKDTLFEYQIQLKDLVEENLDIPETWLQFLAGQFDIMRRYGIQAVVRPIYDWDGEVKPEPEFKTILRHIKQLSTVFSQNEDVILCIEAGLLGPYGEWHSTRYAGTRYQKKILQAYLDSTPVTMQISIRCPRFYRAIFDTDQPVSETNAFSGTDAARIGFHNDGYLGSESDLGTYTTWTRGQELEFQDSHNRYLVFGGEATLISEYGGLSAAAADMEKTHCTYLNKTHYVPLKEKWKQERYEGGQTVETEWLGRTGYDYIRDHLGYRFVIKKSMLSDKVRQGRIMTGILWVQNVGFGNIIKEKQVTLILEQQGRQHRIPLDFDLRDWQSGKTTETLFRVKLPVDIGKGEWEVLLQAAGSNGVPVRFANPDTYSEKIQANRLGKITVLY